MYASTTPTQVVRPARIAACMPAIVASSIANGSAGAVSAAGGDSCAQPAVSAKRPKSTGAFLFMGCLAQGGVAYA